LPSSPTSESSTRLVRAILDPYALGLSAVAAAAAAVLGWSLGPVLLAFLVVMVVRVGSEFVIPRGAQLELADSVAARRDQVRAALARVESLALRGGPPEVVTRVKSIGGIILEISERPTTLAASSPQLFSVLRTATDYLPNAIDAYLKLPQGYATTRRLADGRTPLGVLLEQLQLLEEEMIDVADAVTQNDLNRLLAHGRFLNQRFGRSALTLPGASR
jgi:hypothetical protein